MKVANKFEVADRIADRIIDILNEEVRDASANAQYPVQIFAGLLLALMGYMRTAPSGVHAWIIC